MQDLQHDSCKTLGFPVHTVQRDQLTDDAFCSAFDDFVYLIQKYVPFEDNSQEWQDVQEGLAFN